MIDTLPTSGTDRSATIRRHNDTLRQRQIGGRVMLTAGIRALGLRAMRDVLAAVARFVAFDASNDPHGEHDFGAVEVAGIVCSSRSMPSTSPSHSPRQILRTRRLRLAC